MKKMHRWLGVALAGMLCLSVGGVTGCKKKNTGTARIWSTYNTLKVLRDYDGPPADGGTYPDLGQKLDILMALGDTEGAQLIVTPDHDVRSATLRPGVMRMHDGTVFPSDKIAVYYQYYIEVLNKTGGQQNFNYPTGWVPDMMVPMDLSVQYGENSIGKGHNQGFTVEFTTTSATKSGTYTGTFTLDLDGVLTPIPVTVRVADIDITKGYGQTSIWVDSIGSMYGKYDNATFYKTYYEQSLNEYKFCMQYLPDMLDPVKMAQNAVYYWDNPNFTSFGLPANAYRFSGNLVYMKRGDVYDYLYALAKASTPDMLLAERAYFSVLADEPSAAQYQTCVNAVQDVYLVEDQVIADLAAEDFYAEFPDNPDFRAALEKSIRTVPIIQTVNRSQASVLGTSINSYCAHIHQFNSSSNREMYRQLREANGDRGSVTWYYTCIEPTYPHPADHLDDYQISLRTMRWMQKEYDLDGYLHWDFFLYKSNSVSGAADPYDDALRFPGVNGDGFKTYPGTRYGLDGYLPSIRLATFRDGQEDYNMLCALEAKIAENEKFYGLPAGSVVKTDVLLVDLYRSLYDGTIYNPDDGVFYRTREKLFELFEKLSSDSRLSVAYREDGDQSVSTVYLDPQYSLKVNGKVVMPSGVAGQGVKYECRQPLSEETLLDIEIVRDGHTVDTMSVFLAGATVSLTLADGSDALSVSDGCGLSYADGKAQAALIPQGDDFITRLEYVPALVFRAIGDLETVQDIMFTVTNTGDKTVTLKAGVASAFNSLTLSTLTLEPGEKRQITISSVYSYKNQYSWLSDATFRLFIDNIDASGELTEPAYITVEQVWYTKVQSRSMQ